MTDSALPTGPHRSWWWRLWPGLGAQILLGSSVAVISVTQQFPVFAVQALRYAVAALAVVVLARLAKVQLVWPSRAELRWVLGGAASGLVAFNLATILGTRHAEPAVLGAAVGCIPLALAVIGPLSQHQLPSRRLVVAAIIVSAGGVAVAGLGRSDPIGMLAAASLIACEVGFTIFGAVALPRMGAWSYSAATAVAASLAFAGLSAVVERPDLRFLADPGAVGAVSYLGVVATAVAFILWFTGVERLGPGAVGLCAGVAGPAAGLIGMALGAPAPGVGAWFGMALIASGLAVGFARRSDQGCTNPAAVAG